MTPLRRMICPRCWRRLEHERRRTLFARPYDHDAFARAHLAVVEVLTVLAHRPLNGDAAGRPLGTHLG
jgi:hypothetical protein